MRKPGWLKKIGYKVLSSVFKNGIPVSINKTMIRLPVDYFRLFPGDYEQDNFEFVKSNVKPGDVVLDIGGHIGLMAVLFGKIVKENGKVFSFEPTPGSYLNLRETIRINKMNKIVSPLNMAVTERSGPVDFFISDNIVDVANTLTPYEKNKELKVIKVEATSIDDFVIKHKLNKINFIKIDAEGAELKVLKGGSQTISQLKPKINLALHPEAIIANNDSLSAIYDYINELGYYIYYRNQELGKAAFCGKENLFDVHLFANKQ
jgi:FkbM family methyltransferase